MHRQPQHYSAPAPLAYAPQPQLLVRLLLQKHPQPQLLLQKHPQPQLLLQNPVHYAPSQPQVLSAPVHNSDPYFPEDYNPSKVVKSTYGPPGHTPPPMITKYEPTAKFTDVFFNSPEPTVFKAPAEHYNKEPLVLEAPTPSLLVENHQPLYAPEPPHAHPVVHQSEPVYYDQGHGKTIRHVYVHAAPDEPVTKQTRFIKPKSNSPDVHYQIVFVKTPAPQVADETLIELPPQPKQKTIVYLLSRAPHVHNDVKVVAPPPTKPGPPEVHFIRYANQAPAYPVVKEQLHLAPAPVLLQPQHQPQYLVNAGMYAPQMHHTLYAPPAQAVVQAQPQLPYGAKHYKRNTRSNEEDSSVSVEEEAEDNKDSVEEATEE